MEKDDVTVRVLLEIRDRLDQTNSRLDHLREDLGQRIDETNNRVDETNRRVTALDLHLSTELASVAGGVHDVTPMLRARQKDNVELHERIGRVERDVADLEKQVG